MRLAWGLGAILTSFQVPSGAQGRAWNLVNLCLSYPAFLSCPFFILSFLTSSLPKRNTVYILILILSYPPKQILSHCTFSCLIFSHPVLTFLLCLSFLPYPLLSLSYLIQSFLQCPSYPVLSMLSHLIISHPILSCPILCHFILSCLYTHWIYSLYLTHPVLSIYPPMYS